MHPLWLHAIGASTLGAMLSSAPTARPACFIITRLTLALAAVAKVHIAWVLLVHKIDEPIRRALWTGSASSAAHGSLRRRMNRQPTIAIAIQNCNYFNVLLHCLMSALRSVWLHGTTASTGQQMER
jgi:hypothetical protein